MVKKNAEEKLSKMLMVRLTNDEYKLYQKIAKSERRSGVGDLMRWVMAVLVATGKKFKEENTFFRGL